METPESESLSKRGSPCLWLLLFFAFFPTGIYPCSFSRVLISSALAESEESPSNEARAYLEQLLTQAEQLRLSESPAWRKLLQMHHTAFGLESRIDDPKFFLAKDGKYNPRAELEADLRGFFSHEAQGPADQTTRCAFPARFHYLKSQLNIDESLLPKLPCDRFEEWSKALDARGVTLIYPSAYLNNPASMFGHTLLRLDGAGQDDSTRLLAYGASFSAATNETSGLLFAFRGIFGLYHGVFSVSPYYRLVKDYSDIENRDIWEYQLNFTEEEVAQIVRHLWELGSTWSEYYFFDENCSFALLTLLEGAVPRLKASEDFSYWAIPPETIRSLMKEQGLIGQIRFRPAKSTLVQFEERNLSEENTELARKLARGELEFSEKLFEQSETKDIELEDRARVLELAYDYLEYRQDSGKGDDGAGGRARKLLAARQHIGSSVVLPKVPAPSIRPDRGHLGGRLTLGGGIHQDRAFTELGVRPAFHELLDPEGGYVRGAELTFFETKLRLRDESGFALERFTPLAIRSLSARSKLFRPISWKVGLQVQRTRERGVAGDFLASNFDVGAGLARELWNKRALVFGLFTGVGRASDHIRGDLALGAGPEFGLLLDVSEKIRLQAESIYHRFGASAQENDLGFLLNTRYSLGERDLLRLDFSRHAARGNYASEILLKWARFF